MPTVRAGTAVVMDANGIPVRMVVKTITADGVEIEAATLTERLFIPGSFKSVPATENPAPGFLRYLECKDLPLETILRLIADGQSTKEIAFQLNLSGKTVDTHRAQLMDRLAIHDVAGLVRYAIRTGLVDSGG